MRVLGLRDSDAADETAAALGRLGHEALLAPVIDIEPTPMPLPSGPFDALLATSRHAFTQAPDARGRGKRLPVFAVGRRTAEAARAAGFEVVVAPQARAWHRVSASTGGEARSTHTLYYGVRNTVVTLERRRPLGRLGTAARRGSILATFVAHALTRSDRGAALSAVREGFGDAMRGRLGERRTQRGSGASVRR